jgi:probable HAF family extracellular repeat protein
VACAINDRGQVAGVSKLANGADHLFLWDRENGMQDLGPVVEDKIAISDRGQIVGTMRDPNDCNRAFVWDLNSGRRVLPTLGGENAESSAINNLGQVVGHADAVAGDSHAFVWDAANGIYDLTASRANPGQAFSINDAGQIVVYTAGGSAVVGTEAGRAASFRALPFPLAFHINNAGAVAGLLRRGKGRFDVAVWHPDSGARGVAQLKGTVPGGPSRINDVGQVLFWQDKRPIVRLFGRTFFSAQASSYLWDARQGRITLNACVSLGRGDELTIIDLNNRGALVGVVRRRNGPSDGVLLEPVPERWGK